MADESCTDRGVSDQQRNQIMGHMGPGKSETFFKYYLSTTVIVDVQAIFLGQPTRSELLKQVAKMQLRFDGRIPKSLNAEQKQDAWSEDSRISEHQTAAASLRRELVMQYGSKGKSKGSAGYEKHEGMMKRIRTLKAAAERHKLRRLLETYHETADLDDCVAQLRGEKPPSHPLRPVDFALEDRRWLAETLFCETDDRHFGEIVERMARLALQSEDRRQGSTQASEPASAPASSNVQSSACSSPPGLSPAPPEPEPAQILLTASSATTVSRSTQTGPSLPQTVITQQPSQSTRRSRLSSPKPLACLFCYGQPGKKELFRRSDTLRLHYQRTHFQYATNEFLCPVVSCHMVIRDVRMFMNHAKRVHKSDLGKRAPIKTVPPHQRRLGQIQTFVG